MGITVKVQVERKDGDAWKQTSVQLGYSRNGNCWFRLNGATYVFKDFKVGCEVLVKTEQGWTKAGRVARGCVFLGEGKTYSETMEEQALKEPLWVKPVFA
jgi:hypothetical protein